MNQRILTFVLSTAIGIAVGAIAATYLFAPKYGNGKQAAIHDIKFAVPRYFLFGEQLPFDDSELSRVVMEKHGVRVVRVGGDFVQDDWPIRYWNEYNTYIEEKVLGEPLDNLITSLLSDKRGN